MTAQLTFGDDQPPPAILPVRMRRLGRLATFSRPDFDRRAERGSRFEVQRELQDLGADLWGARKGGRSALR